MTLSRMLAAMLATAALITTPAAAAKPIEGPVDMHQSTAEARARALAAQEKQDLRMPDRRDDESAAMKMLRRIGPPAYPSPTTSLPAYPSPKPIATPAPSKPVASTDDDGLDWQTIGIGVGLSVVLVCAIGALSLRLRRRERVAV